MNTAPTVFEVTAIEYFAPEKDEAAKAPKIHHFRTPIISTTRDAVEFEVKRNLTKKMADDKVAAFFGRLEVKVEAVNFPG
jgi:ribosomal protein L23